MVSWEREPLEETELAELLDAADEFDSKHSLVIYTLAYTGMRASELAHMTRDWIHFQDGEIRIPPEETCDRGCCSDDDGVWTPKTAEGARRIPLRDERTRQLLRWWFAESDTLGMSRMTLYRRVRDVAAETGITKKVTPHVLRHTFGTRLAAQDFTASAIQSAMGHADLETSQKYIKFSGRRLHEEFDEKWRSV
ncbi:tyrosine-type recombinase/integrase [Halogeometricum luteum]|uniref:Site-specific integrase n=1 Tax=Halogeometricum luteum TaxID=2950537 RepID=A0ABU2G8I2_9EURY|nr:site-specific integrase [Halogeometricum sp. S3BR5-2]MDS0297115.1 site-specific integrase [Halogeometricum sp. S3BR5-2]